MAAGSRRSSCMCPQRELDDLRERLARTRWLDEFPGSGWAYGTSRSYLEELCGYWRDGLRLAGVRGAAERVRPGGDGFRRPADPRHPRPVAGAGCAAAAAGARLAGFGVRVREGHRAAARPGAARRPRPDAFHVVCPSIPGYGFSGPTVGPGWNVRRISAAFALLMQRLGYQRYGAAGGDWGAIISTDLVRSGAGTGVCALYLTMPLGEPPDGDPEAGLSDSERQGLSDWAAHRLSARSDG